MDPDCQILVLEWLDTKSLRTLRLVDKSINTAVNGILYRRGISWIRKRIDKLRPTGRKTYANVEQARAAIWKDDYDFQRWKSNPRFCVVQAPTYWKPIEISSHARHVISGPRPLDDMIEGAWITGKNIRRVDWIIGGKCSHRTFHLGSKRSYSEFPNTLVTAHLLYHDVELDVVCDELQTISCKCVVLRPADRNHLEATTFSFDHSCYQNNRVARDIVYFHGMVFLFR